MLQLDEGNKSEYEEIQTKVTFCSESFMEDCSPMGLLACLQICIKAATAFIGPYNNALLI